MERNQADKNRAMRGVIMRRLGDCYPSPTMVESLRNGLLGHELMPSGDISAYLEYLDDRGYISIQDTGEKFGAPIRYIKLTSKGIDLLEGTISDPGVAMQ